MRHDDRHPGKIHGDVVNQHRVAVLQTDAAAAGHARADAAVSRVKEDRQLRAGKHFVQRIRDAIVWRKTLKRRVEFQSANAARRDEPLRFADALGAARRIDAREGNRDVGVLGGKLRDLVVRHHRPSCELFVHRKHHTADPA